MNAPLSLAAALSLALAVLPPAFAQSGAPEPPLGATLAGVLAHARTHHPELAAMRHEAAAAAARVHPAGALPDPTLRVELENVGNTDNGSRFSVLPSKVGETKYTLMQMLPLGGKREARRGAAEAEARAAEARAAAAWNELAAKLKTAWAQLRLAHDAERSAGDIAALMARLEQTAQARYAGNVAPQGDVIRAQLELTSMRTDLLMLEAERRQAQARLNALLAREPAAPLAEPQDAAPLPALTPADAPALLARARAANPALAAEAARVAAAERNRDLARGNRVPDVQVGISPTQMRNRITAWALMVELNIPLQRETLHAQQREADAMLDAQRERARTVANQLGGELGEHLAALDAARRTDALLAERLLPQAELALRSSLAGYEAGRAEFSMLLEAQRAIRKARQDRLKAQAEARMRLAEIERLIGEDL